MSDIIFIGNKFQFTVTADPLHQLLYLAVDLHKRDLTPGYYCAFRGGMKMDAATIEKVKDRMGELADMDLLVTKKSYPAEEAVALFSASCTRIISEILP